MGERTSTLSVEEEAPTQQVAGRAHPSGVDVGLLKVALLASLSVLFTGCTWTFLFASLSVAVDGTASYTVELHNDEVNPLGPITVYTLFHVPDGWQFLGGNFTSTSLPLSGAGAEIADPGFTCDAGPDLTAPGAGRRRVVVSWGTFPDVDNPDTGEGTHLFDVGVELGDHTIDAFFVAQGGGSTICSAGISTVTRVEEALFTDGFESGDTSAW